VRGHHRSRRLAGFEYRNAEHLIDSHGICHRVHHALKAALQLLSPGTVHHSYHIVILGGNHRCNSRNCFQAKARQQILIILASGGKFCTCICSLRLVHQRESKSSGAGGELYANARRKTVLCSKGGIDYPSSDLNSVVRIGTELEQCFPELLLAEEGFR